jgi:predicted nucleotidyltransferase
MYPALTGDTTREGIIGYQKITKVHRGILFGSRARDNDHAYCPAL